MTENAPPAVPHWKRIRLDAAARSLLDRAVGDLGRQLGLKLRLLRLPSGMVTACRVDDLWFCRVGDGGDPPRLRTLAVDSRPEQRNLLPGEDDADFAECADILGLRTDDERARFRAFLDPVAHPAGPATTPGAS